MTDAYSPLCFKLPSNYLTSQLAYRAYNPSPSERHWGTQMITSILLSNSWILFTLISPSLLLEEGRATIPFLAEKLTKELTEHIQVRNSQFISGWIGKISLYYMCIFIPCLWLCCIEMHASESQLSLFVERMKLLVGKFASYSNWILKSIHNGYVYVFLSLGIWFIL